MNQEKQAEALRLANELNKHRDTFSIASLADFAAAELRRLHAVEQELAAMKATPSAQPMLRTPLTPYTLREIIKKLNANHDEDGWNFGDLAHEVEIYHGITQEKQG